MQTCDLYLQKLASDLHSKKEARNRETWAASPWQATTFAAQILNFGLAQAITRSSVPQVKDYLLQWNVAGLSENSVQGAVSTIDSITASPPLPLPHPPGGQQSSDNPVSHPVPAIQEPQVQHVRVSSGVTQGLIIKKVQPVYPQEAKYKRIQGSVHLNAVISKTGDVVDLEVADGPIELVVSAVNAVRQWKYRPYILKGKPVEVQTMVTVNYTISGL